MALRQIGNYRLDSLLGTGGMGEVYEAYDTQRNRFVALKLLPQALSGDQEYIQRFRRESNVAARLRDPHVIPIHDFGEIDGQLFIDMRLVDGADIGALLSASGRIEPERAVRLVSQAAEALDAAHADHLVHRDIKPSNILVTANDFVYVVDFGIARPMGDRQTPLTSTGVTIGTLHYMAPERFTGRDIDGRADVYSLACLLHECLTGGPPFRDRELAALMYAQLYHSPPAASNLADGIPPALDAVIARGMAKDPADRFPTAGALAAAAREALVSGAPVPPAPPIRNEPPTQPPIAAAPWPAAERPPDPEPEPASVPTVPGAPASPTRSVAMAGTRPPAPPAESPAGPPPAVPAGAAAGAPAAGPARRPAWLRRGVPILAVAAAVALAIVLVVVLSPDQKTGHAAGGQSPGNAPALAVPTVAETISVGGNPSYVEVAPDSKFAYITNPGTDAISVLDTVHNKVTATIKIPQGPPQSVAFSSDGRTAYVSVYGSHVAGAIVIVSTVTGKVTATVPVDNQDPGPPETSPDGRYLYVPNHDMVEGVRNGDVLDVIDTVTKKVVDSLHVQPNPHWVAVDDKDGVYYVTDHMSADITVLDVKTNAIIKTIEVGETPHAIALSPDNSRLAISSWSGNQVYMVNTATGKEIADIHVGKNPLDVEYSPDGRYLFTADHQNDTVTVINPVDNRVIANIATGRSPNSIGLTPHQAYVADEDSGSIEVLNLPA